MEQIELAKGTDVWTVKLLREKLKIHLAAKEEAERQTNSPIENRPLANKTSIAQNFSTSRFQGFRNVKPNTTVTGSLFNSSRLLKTNGPLINSFPVTYKRLCLYCQ